MYGTTRNNEFCNNWVQSFSIPMLNQFKKTFFGFNISNGSRTCPGGGGGSSGPSEKCVIWASEYNLGPQIWGAAPPPGSATATSNALNIHFCPLPLKWPPLYFLFLPSVMKCLVSQYT